MTQPANPTPPGKLHGLDHLRAFAIFYVFLFHYFIISKGQPSWLPDWASFGWTGVDLFFVLSGFLISSQLFARIKAGQGVSFKTFFLKRVFRIIPAFLVVVAIYFLIPFFREKESLPPLWRFLAFTQNLGLNLQQFGTFSHAWSLCVEEHFYLFLPLLLILLTSTGWFRKAGWLLLFVFIAGFVIRYLSYTQLYEPHSEDDNNWMYWYKYIYYPTWSRLDGLVAGVSIAALYQFRPALWAKLSKYGNAFILLGLLLLTGAYFLCEDQSTLEASVFGFPLVSLGYGFVVMGAVSPTSFLYKTSSRITSFIATLSYAVYLSHKGVIHITHEWFRDLVPEPHLLLLLSMLTCIIAAWLLHVIVEKPFMQWRHKIVKE